MVKRAPMGDPIEVRIRSYELTLRVAEAQAITITDIRDELPQKETRAEIEEIMHRATAKAVSITSRNTSTRFQKAKPSLLL